LRPNYETLEEELPVAGQDWIWGDPHRYAHHAHPVSGNGEVFLRGASALGIRALVGPVAIPNGRFGNRPHCIYRGFCLQGCKVNAKASPLITHVPDALAHGAEIRANCHVSKVHVDARTNRAIGVTYLRDGMEHFQRAKAVAVAGYSIETPRLLMLSATDAHPHGLGNDHDQLGRYLMVQGAPQTAGRFDAEIRMYKAPPPEVTCEEFYEDDPSKPYRRGFAIQNVSPLPITWAEHVAAQGHWGKDLRDSMRTYVHWATLGALCEFLPRAENRVTLAEEKDRHGLPVAHFAYSQGENDKLLLKAAQEKMEDILKAAGASEVMTITRNAHLVGGARMAATAEKGVVDSEHRVFGVDRLYVADGSVLPTQGSANPALTIMALAARLADKMIEHGRFA
jgi:choline dehydrogenase-like flavoprotein